MNLIFGHTRYSVFNPDAKTWRAAKFLSKNDYIKHLFDCNRLSIRDFIFNEISIPNIIENLKSYENYFHIIEYSEELPEKFKSRLLKSISLHDRIIPVERGGRNKVIQRIVEGSENVNVVAVFKLDDDDVLSKNYITHALTYVDEKYSRFCVSFPLGVTGWFDRIDNKYLLLKKSYQAKINIGLMQIIPVDKTGRVCFYDIGPHGSCDYRFPTILDSSFYSYLWTRTGEQDTAIHKEDFSDRVLKKLSKMDDAEPEVVSCFIGN